MEYIYLIQLREHIKTNEDTYKIGKTKQKPGQRMGAYPKDSELKLMINVDNCDIAEKDLLKIFTNTFIKKKEYGNEYFHGDYRCMIHTIVKYINDTPDANKSVKAVFPGYSNDYSYGGNCKLIRQSDTYHSGVKSYDYIYQGKVCTILKSELPFNVKKFISKNVFPKQTYMLTESDILNIIDKYEKLKIKSSKIYISYPEKQFRLYREYKINKFDGVCKEIDLGLILVGGHKKIENPFDVREIHNRSKKELVFVKNQPEFNPDVNPMKITTYSIVDNLMIEREELFYVISEITKNSRFDETEEVSYITYYNIMNIGYMDHVLPYAIKKDVNGKHYVNISKKTYETTKGYYGYTFHIYPSNNKYLSIKEIFELSQESVEETFKKYVRKYIDTIGDFKIAFNDKNSRPNFVYWCANKPVVEDDEFKKFTWYCKCSSCKINKGIHKKERDADLKKMLEGHYFRD